MKSFLQLPNNFKIDDSSLNEFEVLFKLSFDSRKVVCEYAAERKVLFLKFA